MDKTQAQEAFARTLEQMLAAMPPAECAEAMFQVESLLEDNGIATGNPPRSNPRAFCRALFLSNPNVARLVAEKAPLVDEPIYESPEEMILSLLPSDHHLA